MAFAQTLIDQSGPLPVSVTFNAPSDGEVVFLVSGSVWTSTQNEMIGINILLDGNEIGEAEIFSNGPTTHRAVVPQYITTKLTLGSHTLTLTPSTSATTSDINDSYRVMVLF